MAAHAGHIIGGVGTCNHPTRRNGPDGEPENSPAPLFCAPCATSCICWAIRESLILCLQAYSARHLCASWYHETMRDYDIRQTLRVELQAAHADEPDTLIVEELGLCEGRARADFAVVNGAMNGYEIKSERDTLERLPRQREFYARCFDRVFIVVATRHVDKVIKAVPSWWGIIRAESRDGKIGFATIREASANENVNAEAIVQFLWRNEALDILSQLGLATGLRTKRRRDLWAALVHSLPPAELARRVREKIKARGDWRPEKRRVRGSGSSPTSATARDCQANLRWLLAAVSQHRLD